MILFQFSLILIVCFPEHVLIFLALVDQLPNLTFQNLVLLFQFEPPHFINFRVGLFGVLLPQTIFTLATSRPGIYTVTKSKRRPLMLHTKRLGINRLLTGLNELLLFLHNLILPRYQLHIDRTLPPQSNLSQQYFTLSFIASRSMPVPVIVRVSPSAPIPYAGFTATVAFIPRCRMLVLDSCYGGQ